MFWLVRFVTFNVLVTPPLLPTTTSPRASGDGDQASGATPVPLNGSVAAGSAAPFFPVDARLSVAPNAPIVEG